MNSKRQQRQQRYGRFLGMAALGSVLPGSGLIAAGKRKLGTGILVLLGLALVVALVVFVLVPRSEIAGYAGDTGMLLLVGAGLAAVALVWLLIALGTHRSLEPDGLSTGRRLGGAVVVIVAASAVVAPIAVGSRYAFTQRDLISSISSGGHSNTTPEIDEKNPWENKGRLNVLFLGGDAGEGRDGLRPDTQIVASIDTDTGATTMISLPRNMMGMPFPEDSALSDVYPDGYTGEGDPAEWMLNAVYRNVPDAHPEIFEGVGNEGADANKWAVEGALGIDIDYFMLVDLDGFQKVVDALGGVTVDVPRDIPIANKTLPDGTCSTPKGYVEAGENKHLDGYEALWFARSRCPGDDYERMERQRCVMNAIVAEADPQTLISRYQRLANTAGEIISTDVPEGLFPALIELMMKVQQSGIESLTLDREFFDSMGTTSSDPDFDELHERIDEILNGSGDELATDEPTSDETSEDDTTEADEASSTDGAGSIQLVSDTSESESSESDTESGDDESEGDQPVDTGAVC